MKHTVIIVADRDSLRAEETVLGSVPALIEIAGRKLIEYTLEDLAGAGFEEAVVMSPDVSDLEAFLGNGGRWGIQLRYHLTRRLNSAREYSRLLTGDGSTLVVRSDVLRGCSIGDFVEKARGTDCGLVTGISGGRDTGVYVVNARQTCAGDQPNTSRSERTVEMGDIGLNALADYRDLHVACLTAARGEIPGIERRGKVDGGVVASRQSRIEGVRLSGGTLFVGAGARIASGVSASGTVVIGEGAFVDSGTSLRDCVVMPGSYVGRHLDVNGVIVNGANLVRIDSGAVVKVADEHLLCPLDGSANDSGRGTATSRLLGLALAILSLPLWPVAALAALPGRGGHLIVSHKRVGNRRRDGRPVAFTVHEWTTDIPLLKYLPWLLPVIAGHIQLVGVRPAMAGGSLAVNSNVPAGLLGPASIDVNPDSPEEEVAFSEMIFGAEDSLLLRWRYVARSAGALFTGRAWRRRRHRQWTNASRDTQTCVPQ